MSITTKNPLIAEPMVDDVCSKHTILTTKTSVSPKTSSMLTTKENIVTQKPIYVFNMSNLINFDIFLLILNLAILKSIF